MRVSTSLFAAGSRSRSAVKAPILGSTPKPKSGSVSALIPSESIPWLRSLKSTDLQRIARATGIKSSGTKAVLLERIQCELRSHVHGHVQSQAQDRSQHKSHSGDEPWRILSIDMGIRNLAFAFLTVPCPFSRTTSGSWNESQDQEQIQVQLQRPYIPELQAWRRLSVSDGLDLSNLPTPTPTPTPSSDSESESLAKDKGKEKESYSPDTYASNAYNLIKTLLSAYTPTHILIERQRFRSGGSSAVQEWTLRVGVFEGMMHATLHTLRVERGNIGIVEGVEPKRVVGFWDEIGRTGGGSGIVKLAVSASEKKPSAREVKKAKMGIVGGWVEGSLEGRYGKVIVGEDEAVRELAGAYVRKWKGEKGKKVDIGKLDDLADCLLQGITWLEWQVMRERLVREGLQALDCT
ncbi:hypothetical protein N7520_006879 [Penicillium odoratum]|uniref:uncharacterized protein n=1 Tax=Penicillium odoratum TaxID=1167516 RepID=UPI0025470040|nr:uncharacterized protein N7520_006879 [Penicillium odoratum]KAJ5759723.1 hypothetical protein N7520_006879 [Penicillium odoratum]